MNIGYRSVWRAFEWTHNLWEEMPLQQALYHTVQDGLYQYRQWCYFLPLSGCHWSVSLQTLQNEEQHQVCLQCISLACHNSLDHWNRTSNYPTKWHSTAPGLGGRVGGVRSGNVISLPATKTFRIFLSSLKMKICEYTFTPNSLSHHSNWHPSVS